MHLDFSYLEILSLHTDVFRAFPQIRDLKVGFQQDLKQSQHYKSMIHLSQGLEIPRPKA